MEALAAAQQLTNDNAAAAASLRRALKIRIKAEGFDAPGVTDLQERINSLQAD